MVARASLVAFVALLVSASASDAFERLPVPGGTNALRAVTEMPSSVPDDMLLVEVARSWYGARDPLANPDPGLRRMLDYFRSAREPLADGPPLPLTTAAWAKLLDCQSPCDLATALVMNRNAMLLYYGFIAMDQDTQRWLAAHPILLTNLLADGAAAVAVVGPFVHVRGEAVVPPGGEATRAAWGSVVGREVSRPEAFIRALMRRDGGRIAWLLSVLAQLDAPHQRFALAGPESLSALARHAASSSPEWTIAERPFWRTPFDFTLVLALTDLTPAGGVRGSLGFWREVFRSDDLSKWKADATEPLTAETLLAVLFEQPYLARERWEVFSLGQRLSGTEGDDPDTGLMLRGARRHPALSQMLDRIGVTSPSLVLSLHRAARRLSDRDEAGAHGELGAWQGALAIVERAALSGGLDAPGVETALSSLAALRLDDPRSELTAWFMDSFVGTLAARPGAPPDAERLVLQTLSGSLTPTGPRREATFSWEDLPYSFGAAASLVTRMEQARVAQGSATVEDARVAWRLAAGEGSGEAEALAARLRDVAVPAEAPDIARRIERARNDRDASSLKREARRAANAIVAAVLTALPYVPHLAVTETPALGADVAFRHEFVSRDDGPYARRQRPWQIARGQAAGGAAWHLEGSLLMLDLALADWYLRRNAEPAGAPPMFDEGDRTALAQVAALARSAGAARIGLPDATAAVGRGRQLAAAAASMSALGEMLEQVGVDPWRRWAVSTQAAEPAQAAALLSYGEAWRLGGAPGLLSPHPAIDGGAHFGVTPRSLLMLEGRRSSGLIGAAAVDAQLRVATFLEAKRLPDRLFGDVAAGVLGELIEATSAPRPDDFTAFAARVSQLDDTRIEEHLLALVADGTLARPADLH